MNTIEELVYYCNEHDPVGALMLTGEWRCGKTNLLEHQLVDALKDSHIIVRVSLFGIESIDVLDESQVIFGVSDADEEQVVVVAHTKLFFEYSG